MDINDPTLSAEERSKLLDEIETKHLTEATAATLVRMDEITKLADGVRRALAARDYQSASILSESLHVTARANSVTVNAAVRVDLERKARLFTV